MIPEQHLDAIAADSAHFASATAGALTDSIDFLDGWKINELVAHLGGVYSFVIANTAHPSTEYVAPGPEAAAPDGDELNDWFAERRTTLLATLSAASDEESAWTFVGVRTPGWWKRRMAHETSVHRWDAEAGINGIGDANPIDSELAADGVDEFFEVRLRRPSEGAERVYPTQTLHLHRTDGPGEWMLAADPAGGVSVTHEHGKGDAAVRGPASSLALWMWGRPPKDIELFGDEAVAQAWQDLTP